MRSIGPLERDPAKFAAALNYLTKNRWGTVTLGSGTSTTITDPTLNPDTLIFFDPLTKEAEAVRPLVLLENRLRGRFIITHASGLANCSYHWYAAGD